MQYTPPYFYVGLYEYEQRCEAENAEKIAQANERFERDGKGGRILRLASLVWTTECLPPEWDGVIKENHSYLFQ